jgi:hypothetical protein
MSPGDGRGTVSTMVVSDFAFCVCTPHPDTWLSLSSAPFGNVPPTDQPGTIPAPPSDFYSKRSVEFDRKVKEFSDAIESLKVLRQETPKTAPSAAQGLSSSSHPTDRSDSDRSGRYSPVETCQTTNGVNVAPGVLPHGKGSVSASLPTPREGNASEPRG